ncbi:uncharacterized protein LOC131952373 [Physella acuta]|uniref:uncharacterized protein LOC131952373 n=1 Tax=Physella acuta TaxID=109671 RepID=UPI0027DD5A6C|nr:uncharacterized protein LOC131952373 [Physella acuta]
MMFRSLVIAVLVLLELTVGQISTSDCGQLEPISDDEVELIEKKDNDFDQMILSNVARPVKRPAGKKMSGLYYDQYRNGSIVVVEEPLTGCHANSPGTGISFTQLAKVNLYVQYLQYPEWYLDYKKCCPASQNYGCRSVKKLMPCFYHYIKPGIRAWCCPLERIKISNCNCGKCAIFCPDCLYSGQCQRRYKYTKFAAGCDVRWWGTIVNFAMYLPTSCYCRQV